ncbi:FH2 domain-containing protein 1 [Stigmatopora argus]
MAGSGVPPLPPAPPPPPPAQPCGRKRRVRSFFWKPIPEEKVRQRPNMWTLAGRRQPYQIDASSVEELFCRREEAEPGARRAESHSPAFKDPAKEGVNILDSKRGINVGIFLKQFKKSNAQIVEDIRQGSGGGAYGARPLKDLLKLLPDADEAAKLRAFRGDPDKLPLADSFMFLLIQVPRLEVRMEAMVLDEEFAPSSALIRHDVDVLRAAARELMSCEELHAVLHLVLQAGNILNAGGYAGNAAGFKLSSLLSLADTKANKPGMNLLHFVAMEAEKKDEALLKFPDKLSHVQSASRISVENTELELSSLHVRIQTLEEKTRGDSALLEQLEPFLQSSSRALADLNRRHRELRQEGEALVDFFCEDKDAFKLDEGFRIFRDFGLKFKKAVQDNVERQLKEAARRRRLKELEERRSAWSEGGAVAVAGPLARSGSENDVESLTEGALLDFLRGRSPRSSGARRRVVGSPEPFYNSLPRAGRKSAPRALNTLARFSDPPNIEKMTLVSAPQTFHLQDPSFWIRPQAERRALSDDAIPPDPRPTPEAPAGFSDGGDHIDTGKCALVLGPAEPKSLLSESLHDSLAGTTANPRTTETASVSSPTRGPVDPLPGFSDLARSGDGNSPPPSRTNINVEELTLDPGPPTFHLQTPNLWTEPEPETRSISPNLGGDSIPKSAMDPLRTEGETDSVSAVTRDASLPSDTPSSDRNPASNATDFAQADRAVVSPAETPSLGKTASLDPLPERGTSDSGQSAAKETRRGGGGPLRDPGTPAGRNVVRTLTDSESQSARKSLPVGRPARSTPDLSAGPRGRSLKDWQRSSLPPDDSRPQKGGASGLPRESANRRKTASADKPAANSPRNVPEPAPEEKMCRSATAWPARESSSDVPGFARGTVASSCRTKRDPPAPSVALVRHESVKRGKLASGDERGVPRRAHSVKASGRAAKPSWR